ncbi:MAG: oxidoreductase [Chloroflexi bacterium]|nr:MAG: oxidoreductase [Chloroflexota bacterium]
MVERTLQGRVAIVTGASRERGIGAAVCRALAQRGADVVFTHWQAYDREMAWGAEASFPEQLAAELAGLGVRALALEADLSDAATPARIIDVAGQLGPPRILVNNAAHSTHDGYQALDAATLDAHYAVNLRGTALLAVEFCRRYDGQPGGRIINFTSGQSLGPMPGELAYIATKGAIEAFTRTLAVEVGHLGITVNAVDPGPTDTGWMPEDLKTRLARQFPAGRLGQAEDAARLVAFLADDAAAWVTGQVIHSDGGFFPGG